MSWQREPEVSAPEPPPRVGITSTFVGATVGIGTTYVVLFVSGFIFLWFLALQGVPTQELYVRAYQSTAYLVFAHVLGFLCAAPGGYWSARLSPVAPYKAAVAAGVLVAVFSLSQNFLPYPFSIPLWSRVASVVLPVPGFVLGAFWRQRAA